MVPDASASSNLMPNGRGVQLDMITALIPTVSTPEKLDLIARLTQSMIRTYEQAIPPPEQDDKQTQSRHEEMLKFIDE